MDETNQTNRVGRWLINDTGRTARVSKMPQCGPRSCTNAQVVLFQGLLAHATFKYNGAGRDWDAIVLEDIDGTSVKLTRSILKEALELMEAFQPSEETEETEPIDHRAAAVSTAARILREGIDRAVQAFQTVVTEADDSRALRLEIERLANERYDLRTAYETFRKALAAELGMSESAHDGDALMRAVVLMRGEANAFVRLRNTIQSLLGDVAGTPVNDEPELERRLRETLQDRPRRSNDQRSRVGTAEESREVEESHEAEEWIITLLSVCIVALLAEAPRPRKFHLPDFFSMFGGSIRLLPDPFGWDAGPFRVERVGSDLTITYRLGR